MSCGLGAVILMFLLVKKNSQEEIKEIPQKQPSSEIEFLKKEEKKLKLENKTLKNLKFKLNSQERDLKLNSEDYDSILNTLKVEEKNNNLRINELEKKIESIDIKKNADSLNLEGKGQQEYLIGLELKGKKIAILLDSSASMTDEKLINIIKRKTESETNKKNGPKWQRTLRIMKWLLVRLPESSKVSVIKFSNNSKILGKKNWYNNNTKDLSILFKEINKIVPANATNLDSAFKAIREMEIKPDEIFILTDGLPTKGSKNNNVSFFSKCNSIIGNAKKISGECREKLFLSSINEASSIIASIKINIILLPLEGDPQASYNFWKLTAKNKGLLFIPSKDWP